jgi:hypothetical protein
MKEETERASLATQSAGTLSTQVPFAWGRAPGLICCQWRAENPNEIKSSGDTRKTLRQFAQDSPGIFNKLHGLDKAARRSPVFRTKPHWQSYCHCLCGVTAAVLTLFR